VVSDGEHLIDPVYVDAISTGSAKAGPYMRGGETLMSSDAAVKSETTHIKHYDGATAFIADYTIVLKADNTVDSTKSTVTFKSLFYTSSGDPVYYKPGKEFTTLPITITSVTLNPDKSIASFSLHLVIGIHQTVRGRTE
jgi:hypothetical protein